MLLLVGIHSSAFVRAFMRTGKIDYGTFARVIGQITVVDNVAIAMGHEVTTPQR